jgi:hypothetical protein
MGSPRPIGRAGRCRVITPQAQAQMCEEEVPDGALKNDNANAVALRSQPARELVELAEHGRVHQVDRSVVDRHARDSALDANVEGVKIRKE